MSVVCMEKIEKIGIGVVGLPGAGKSIVSEVATEEFGIPTIIMGDIVREICQERGFEINPDNLGKIMVNIRKEEGMDAVAKRTLPKVLETKADLVIIDGLRSYEEVELFRTNLSEFIVIAIHASPKTRFTRIQQRQRLDDSQDFQTFQDRDSREISAGIAKIIALADMICINEGKIKTLKKQISKIIKSIKQNKWRQPD